MFLFLFLYAVTMLITVTMLTTLKGEKKEDGQTVGPFLMKIPFFASCTRA